MCPIQAKRWRVCWERWSWLLRPTPAMLLRPAPRACVRASGSPAAQAGAAQRGASGQWRLWLWPLMLWEASFVVGV